MQVKERQFSAGRIIFVEGDPAREAFVVKTGSVEIARRHRGQRHFLHLVKAGGVFGEMGLILGGVRSADAVAVEDSVCYVIDQDELDRQLAESPRFVQGLVRILSDHVKRMNDKILEQA